MAKTETAKRDCIYYEDVLADVKSRPWPKLYSIVAGKLRCLPKRLLSQGLLVSIGNSNLYIGNRCYSGVVEVEGNEVHDKSDSRLPRKIKCSRLEFQWNPRAIFNFSGIS